MASVVAPALGAASGTTLGYIYGNLPGAVGGYRLGKELGDNMVTRSGHKRPADDEGEAPPPKKKGFFKKVWDNGGKHVAIAAGTLAAGYAVGKGAQYLDQRSGGKYSGAIGRGAKYAKSAIGKSRTTQRDHVVFDGNAAYTGDLPTSTPTVKHTPFSDGRTNEVLFDYAQASKGKGATGYGKAKAEINNAREYTDYVRGVQDEWDNERDIREARRHTFTGARQREIPKSSFNDQAHALINGVKGQLRQNYALQHLEAPTVNSGRRHSAYGSGDPPTRTKKYVALEFGPHTRKTATQVDQAERLSTPLFTRGNVRTYRDPDFFRDQVAPQRSSRGTWTGNER